MVFSVGMLKKNMRLVASKASFVTRRESLEGRECVVAPVVLMIEGVHNSLYYPAEELKKYPEAWNGVPVTLNHPQDQDDYTSANRPDILEKWAIGRLFNVGFDAVGGRLSGEVWVEVDKAKGIAPEVLSALADGVELEVSTGLWADDDGEPGKWGGEEFSATVLNYRPDHLALLPKAEGACSLKDGCGIRGNESTYGLAFSGIESIEWSGVSTSFSEYREAYYSTPGTEDTPSEEDVPQTVKDASPAMRIWIASKTLAGDAGADTEEGLIALPVVNPRTDRLNELALKSAARGTVEVDKAEKLLVEYFEYERSKKGGSMKPVDVTTPPPPPPPPPPGGGGGGGGRSKTPLPVLRQSQKKGFVRRTLEQVRVALGLALAAESHDETRMSIDAALREEIGDKTETWAYIREVWDDSVVYEIASGAESHLYRRSYAIAEGKVSFGDAEEVKEERSYVPVAEDADESASEDSSMNKEVEMANKKEAAISALIACESTRFTEENRKWLDTLTECELELLRAPDPPKVEDPPKVLTVEEYIVNAPLEVRETLKRWLSRDKAVKDAAVKALLENKRSRFTKEQLEAQTIEELEVLAELGQVDVDFSGAAPVVRANEDQVPPMPKTWDTDKKPA